MAAVVNSLCALSRAQVEDRLMRGARDLEVMLCRDDFGCSGACAPSPEDIAGVIGVLDELRDGRYRINALSAGSFLCADFPGCWDSAAEMFALAETAAVLQGSPVAVRVPVATSAAVMESFGILSHVSANFCRILDSFPHALLAFSSPPPVRVSGDGSLSFGPSFGIRNGRPFLSSLDLCMAVAHPRCGVCLDPCIIAESAARARVLGCDPGQDAVAEAFRRSRGKVFLIRLSRPYPRVPSSGAAPASARTAEFLESVRRLSSAHAPGASVTVAVREADPLSAEGYSALVGRMDGIFF